MRPAIEARCPGGVKSVNAVHEHHARAIRDLRERAEDLVAAPPGEREALGRVLYLAFGEFVAENLAHMAEEETLVAPLLASLYSDAELAAIHEQIVAALSPDEKLASARYLAAFAVVLELAREVLGRDDFRDLAQHLGVAA